MKLSIIVPAHNEEDNIVEVIKRIEDSVLIGHELVVVNDHSTDKTLSLVEQLCKEYGNLVLVENKLECGFANAIRIGFYYSIGELLVPVMADLCDDLSTIQVMHEKINQGYDIVCGSRYILGGKRLGGSKLKGFLSNFAGCSLHYLLGVPTSDIANAFKMYKRDVLEKIEIKSKGFEISMEIPIKAFYLGFKITEVPTLWKERAKGKSNFKMFKLLPSYLKLYAWAIFKRLRG
ncbi:MAG: glycosyltransferase [Candidatus Omnitrophota bacterium]